MIPTGSLSLFLGCAVEICALQGVLNSFALLLYKMTVVALWRIWFKIYIEWLIKYHLWKVRLGHRGKANEYEDLSYGLSHPFHLGNKLCRWQWSLEMKREAWWHVLGISAVGFGKQSRLGRGGWYIFLTKLLPGENVHKSALSLSMSSAKSDRQVTKHWKESNVSLA